MWNFVFIVSAIGMFAFPPLLLLAAYALYKVGKDTTLEVERENLRANFDNSHPGPCPVCSAQAWSKGPSRLVPSIGIRDWAFPDSGNASVVSFTCTRCGAYGRYARPYDKPEIGWVLMDRYLGGW